MAEGPSKNDIEAVFKRLRAIPTNKTCFDCGAKNPTWSSVTFGVFICIDCSSVHRNLGVHLTFVRSTQLDTQWTWLQLRNMQLGGNANAHAFFRQHNCSTSDAQQKYTSRAAVLYKEKLANMSQQYMRIHGTTLHVDGHGHGPEVQQEKKEDDFFSQHEAFPDPVAVNLVGSVAFKTPVPEVSKVPSVQTTLTQGPNVDAINAPMTEAAEPKVAKSLIGQRKPAAKKPGLGAKKGLGATKVQTNFDEIEREAQMADAMRAQKPVEVKPEEVEQKSATLSLAFQELAMQTKKQSEIMQKADPKNADQVERIGMGILANKTGSRAAISHSIMSDMTVIPQDSSALTKSNASALSSFERIKFSSDDSSSSLFSMKISGLDDLLARSDSSSKSSRDSEWDMLTDFTPAPKSTSSSSLGASATLSSAYGSSSSAGAKSSNSKFSSSSNDGNASINSGEAVKKFANAKAISSDQFFQGSGSADYERRTNLSRFEGSSGISSADYFGTGSSSSGRSRNAGPSLNLQAPDLDDVRESVRQGVTKVASKLSNLANDFASSIQDRYGY